MKYTIPFGTTGQVLDIPAGYDVELLESQAHAIKPAKDEQQMVKNAMAAPIGSPTLAQLAKEVADVTIICSDHTRPVPSRKIIPSMLAELRSGNPDIDITLLIATGFHRSTTREELVQKFGDDIVARENIVVHDCDDDAAMVNMGALPSGAPLVINRVAAEASLLVAEGFIEPHFFAGYSGGRKSILPGICGRNTVLGNHCSAFIDSPYARTGVLDDNPIQTDMVAAARMARLRYIVNVIINGEKQVIAAFAGDGLQAHEAGCSYLKGLCRVSASRPGDIVVTSNGGYPLDQNIYQSVKGMTAAEAAAAVDAIIIISSACSDGTGSDSFYQALRDCENPSLLLEQVRKIPMGETQPDQWEYQILARILEKHRVIIVCDESIRDIAGQMKLDTADSLQHAFETAARQKGEKARINIIPDGVSVVVECG